MDARLGLVHRSVGVTQATPRVSTALYHLLSTSSLSSTSLSDLESFLKGDTALTDGSPLQTLGANGFSESDSKAAKRFWESSGVELPVEIENDSALLMVNGRVRPDCRAFQNLSLTELFYRSFLWFTPAILRRMIWQPSFDLSTKSERSQSSRH